VGRFGLAITNGANPRKLTSNNRRASIYAIGVIKINGRP